MIRLIGLFDWYSEGEDLSVLFNLYYWDKITGNDAENMTAIIVDKISNPRSSNNKGRKSKAVNVFEGLIIDPASVQIKGVANKSNYIFMIMKNKSRNPLLLSPIWNQIVATHQSYLISLNSTFQSFVSKKKG